MGLKHQAIKTGIYPLLTVSHLPTLQIYKGLAQTGAWGCFDEFNRIPVAVLSVCSTQYKTVLDAIRARKDKFLFDEVEVVLKQTVMAFITMNPGYPGRAELPESLKVRGGVFGGTVEAFWNAVLQRFENGEGSLTIHLMTEHCK